MISVVAAQKILNVFTAAETVKTKNQKILSMTYVILVKRCSSISI